MSHVPVPLSPPVLSAAVETGGWWAGWTFGASISPLLFLGVFIGCCAEKEALLSKFGPAGVKSGLPHSSHKMLSELCRPPGPVGTLQEADIRMPLRIWGCSSCPHCLCRGWGAAHSSSSCAQLCAELPTLCSVGAAASWSSTCSER